MNFCDLAFCVWRQQCIYHFSWYIWFLHLFANLTPFTRKLWNWLSPFYLPFYQSWCTNVVLKMAADRKWLHTCSRSRGHKFIAHSRKTFDYDVPSAVYYILHINYIYSVFIVVNKFSQMLASTMFHDVFIYFSASSLSTCVQRNSRVSLCWCTPAVLYPGTCMLSCNFSSHEKNSRRRSFLLTLPIWFLGISSTTTRPVGMV